MGLLRVPFYGQTGLGHNGGTYGTYSVLYSFKESGISISSSVNGLNYQLNDISIALLSISNGKPYQIPSFVDKLRSVIQVAKVVRAQGKNTDFEYLSKDSFSKNHDRYLQYSIMFSGERAGLITPEALNDFRGSLEQQKIDWKSMQERFETRTPPHYRFAPLLRKRD